MVNPTKNFKWSDTVVSVYAQRHAIDNSLPDKYRPNAMMVLQKMEIIRTALGDVPLIVDNLFRCPALNTAIGGSDNSAHLEAMAIDFWSRKITPIGICNIILKKGLVKQLGIDQLIYEISWVHVGYCEGTPRGQVLTYNGKDRSGKKRYSQGLVTCE